MDLTSAYILHRYPYRENSFLLKVFTEKEGLVTVVARNAKRPKSDWYALLQPFQKLGVAYQGKGSVLTLTRAERMGHSPGLHGKTLFAGFYLNELLLKFLAPHDVHENVFMAYERALIHCEQDLEPALRQFELHLFNDMGLLPDFNQDEMNQSLGDDAWYMVMPDQLPKRIDAHISRIPQHFQGIELKALQTRDFSNAAMLKAAKRFTRLWLTFYGMGRELRSREIFAEVFVE